MIKRFLSLLLALMFVCMGAAALAEDVCSITYYDSDAQDAKSYPLTQNYGMHTLLDPADCGFAAPDDGYAFDGWLVYVGGEFNDMFPAGEMVYAGSEPVELVAAWYEENAGDCTLSFVMDGGSPAFGNEVWGQGRYVMLPPAHQIVPPTEAQAFGGWQIGGETYPGGGYVKLEGTSMTATALWIDASSVTYTVHFSAEGGSGTMQDVQTNPCLYTLPDCGFTAPEGMAFKAWKWMNQEYAPGEQIRVAEDTHVSAKWTEAASETTFTVTYLSQEGEGAQQHVVSGIAYSQSHTLLTPEECGFTMPDRRSFVGWSMDGMLMDPGTTIIPTEDKIVTAVWTGELCYVTLDPGVGEGEAFTDTMPLNSELNLYDASVYGFSCDYATFAGWNDGEETYPVGEKYAIAGDVTLTAQWTPMTDKITFRRSSSSSTDEEVEVEMTYGQGHVMPDPSRFGFAADEGYKFAGWKNANGGKVYQAGESFVLEDWALFVGQWDKLEYTVTFDPGEGGSGSIPSQTIKYYEVCPLPECTFTAPQGHEFKAWLVDGQEHPVGTSYFVTKDTTITAVWQPKMYTITYDLTGAESGSIAPVTVAYGTEHRFAEPKAFETPEGKEFDCWLVDGKPYYPNQPITVTGDMTVVLQLKERTVTLTYLDADGNAIEGHAYSMAYGAEHEVRSLETLKLTAPQGKELGSWLVLNSEGGIIGEVTVGGKLNVYSNWMIRPNWVATDAKTYTLTFDMNGGNPIEPQTAREGAYFETPSRDAISHPAGYEFDHFQIGDAQYGATDFIPATGDMTAKAHWTSNVSRTITFDRNGGEGEMDPVSVLEGSTYTLPECQFDPPTGHGFAGWKVNGGATYMVGADLPVNGDMTLSAQWDPQSFEMSFDANGGSGTQYPAYVTYGSSYVLPECTFTAPEGYHFAGWKSGDTIYQPWDGYDPTGDRVFDAQWAINTYTLTLLPGDGEGQTQTDTLEYGTVFPMVGAGVVGYTKEGSTLTGWTDGTNTYALSDSITMKSDVTLTAVWTKQQFTITFEGESGSMDSVTKEYGDAYKLPACEFQAPINNRFKAWNVNGTEYAVGGEIIVKSDVTVKPVWTWIEYTVEFDANGAEGSIAPVKVLAGTDYTLPQPNALYMEGHDFAGWKVGEETYWPNNPITVNEDVTVVAQWTLGTASLTYQDADGNALADHYYEKKYGEQHTVLTPEKVGLTAPTGKKFGGWAVFNNKGGQLSDVTAVSGEPLTLYSHWLIRPVWVDMNTFTVTFAAGDGSGTQNPAYVYEGHVYELPKCTFEAPVGREFAAWSIGGAEYQPGDGFAVNEHTTVTAVWRYIWYPVTLLPGAGKGEAVSDSMPYGSELRLYDAGVYDMAYEGREFSGWSDGTKTYAAGETYKITGKTTLTAQWKKIAYSVSFDANGGSGAMAADAVEYGDTYVLPKNGFAAPVGHHFKAWSVNGTELAPAAKLENVTANVAVKAVWEKNVYTVTTKDSNDASSATAVSMEYGTAYKLPACAFTPGSEYHSFAYWKVESAAGTSELKAGTTITIESDTVITAIWDFDDSVLTRIEQTEDITSLPAEEKAELEQEMLAEMPPQLQTIDAVAQELEEQSADEGFTEENVEVHDVKLMFKPAGSEEWIVATEENFPTAGIEVRMPLPEGTNASDYEFLVIHMFTTDSERLGTEAGKTEAIVPELVGNELVFTLNGLSPVSVAWKVKEMQDVVAQLPETGDPSSLMGWITLLGASGLGLQTMKRRKK